MCATTNVALRVQSNEKLMNYANYLRKKAPEIAQTTIYCAIFNSERGVF